MLSPEPRHVRWYFDHRLQAGPAGFTAQQIAINDLLWRMLCEQGFEGAQKVLESTAGEAQDACVNTEAAAPACVNVPPSQERDRHPQGYMRGYMRDYRAKRRAGSP